MSEEETERSVLPSAILKISKRVDQTLIEDVELQCSGQTLKEALAGIKQLKEMSKQA
ncbi:MAG: hypothetical protein QF811_07080 [Candidatus Woesearchaeota archaeon]|jgi:hypothetical protein|nr:hypothetical protein [Candidatus Woesearchaeota archaeon]